MALNLTIRQLVVVILSLFILIAGIALLAQTSKIKDVLLKPAISNASLLQGTGEKIMLNIEPSGAQIGTKFLITAKYPAVVENQDLDLLVRSSDYLAPLTLYDDGNHFDGAPNDGLYGGYFDSAEKPYGTYSILKGSDVLGSFQVYLSGCELLKGENNPNNIKIVMVPSGYENLNDFKRDASYILSGEDSLLNTEPFKFNINKFSFFMVNTSRDLGCVIGCRNISSLVCCNEKSIVQEASLCDYDNIVVLLNSKKDCGASSSYAHICAESGYAKPILIHEFGHSFGGLADEYVYAEAYPGYNILLDESGMPNCDISGCDKWKNLTSDCFNGCTYSNLYRSAKKSIMSDLLTPEFSPAAELYLHSIINQKSNYRVSQTDYQSFYVNAKYDKEKIDLSNVLLKPIVAALVTQRTPYVAVLKDKDNRTLFVSNISMPLVLYPITLPNVTNPSARPSSNDEFSFTFLMPFIPKTASIDIYKNVSLVSSTSVEALTDVCGDNVCGKSENHISCPSDCSIENDGFCEISACDPDCPSQKNCYKDQMRYSLIGIILVSIALVLITFILVGRKANSKKSR